jgi:putative Ca2+/H+ antiporter (TMEM165/GDT1 family)
VEHELQASDAMRNSKKELQEGEGKKGWVGPLQQLLYAVVSPVFLKAFTLTFLAEWGDRSQIATIG